ncbi:unnamed protein product [Adineta ricciae]|uniref:Tudor domain-containing protein n=1 Tax=Adineta ricciae TaxID=249248 RepID=A0A815STF6_ADIRI|nr:unnamed protein product [Adineta ricciae]CAF1494239.1 unnamed protein product [Adineta ricciae]
MVNELSNMIIVDEIDRLCVAYDKAKEYVAKLTSNIDQQIEIWQYRRQIIFEQSRQSKSSSSCDFFLPKTQRINDLTIQTVEALCRADLLLEQIHRIDPKSAILPASTSTLVSTRPNQTIMSSSHVRQPTPSFPKQSPISHARTHEQSMPFVPAIRNTQQSISGRLSNLNTKEKTGFQPVITPQSSTNVMENPSRTTPVHTQNMNYYANNGPLSFPRTTPSSSSPWYVIRTTPSEHVSSPFRGTSSVPLLTRNQLLRTKEKVKLQRISSGTIWFPAKIEIIDTLSGFYVENLDRNVNKRFSQMQNQLHNHYDELEKSNQLVPLQNIAIGDFGVAKYSEDDRWYRARLIMCEGQNSIKIVFVDFGNIEIKSINDFYPLHKMFTDLPAQAIACSLSEAFPRSENENSAVWPEEAVQMFKQIVLDKEVKIHFVDSEEGTERWPLHFVRVLIGDQSLTDLPELQQFIEPRSNRDIAEIMAPCLTEQEYILFNVPISEDD